MRTHLINGKIYVNAGEFVEALAIENGEIVAAGTADSLGENCDHQVDLEGRTVLPGFNDSHLHLSYIGKYLGICDLSSARSIDDVVRLGREYLQTHPNLTAMYARGWNQDYFTNGESRMPDRHDADRITTDIPIVMTRVCGHSTVINSRGVETLGIGPDTRIDGGEIVRDENGEPTGLLTETAVSFAESLLPEDTAQDLADAIVAGGEYALSVGITSVQSNDVLHDVSGKPVQALHLLAKDGRIPVRYSAQYSFNTPDELRDFLATEGQNQNDYDERNFRRGALKLFKDGSLGARTAEMLDDYADDPGNRGLAVLTDEQMREFMQLAKENNMRVVTHAIGDGAVQGVIDAYIESNGGTDNPLRHGINHCQITRQEQLDRIVEHNLAVMYQPIFLEYDLQIVEDRVGKAVANTSYAFGSMIRAGAHVSFGSDAPVEDCNPFPGIACAVTRQRASGEPAGGYAPEQKCSVEEAIDAFTLGSAWNEGTDGFKGRLQEGFVADLIVLDRDIFTIDEEEIRDIRVLRTMLDGEWVYENTDAHSA